MMDQEMDDQELQDAVDAAAGALAATQAALEAFKHKNTEGNTIQDEDEEEKQPEDKNAEEADKPLLPNDNNPDAAISSDSRMLPDDDDDRFIYDQWELDLINNPKSGRT